MNTQWRQTLLAAAMLAMLPTSAHSKPLKDTIAETLSSHPQQVRAIERHAASLETIQMDEAGYRPTVDLTAGIGRERAFRSSDNS